IADIDLDGRNDIIVASDFWNGVSGYYDKVWAFDLHGPTPYGPIQWGQFMGGPKHDGRFRTTQDIDRFALLVTLQGPGSVSSSPAGITCGTDCSELYPSGTSVTLTATPDPRSVFTGWGGACSGQASQCTVTMSGARTVTASFSVPLTLTVSAGGTGSGVVVSSPAGISCGTTCSAGFVTGTAVTLTATAGSGSIFSGWGGDCSGQSSTCPLTLSPTRSLTATFGRTVSLTVAVQATNPAGAGSVSAPALGINCPPDCTKTFTSGTPITLTASPTGSSIFAGWTGACAGQGTTCSFTITADQTV